MKKFALLLLASGLLLMASAQRNNTWTDHGIDDIDAVKESTKRSTFPKEKKLFSKNETLYNQKSTLA
ncbi:MAG: hypothetical protein ACKO03_04700 [Bacteroidota bacterium]